MVAFFAVSTWAGIACYSNFQFANNTDAGIITQAVSSTTYHRYAPFFESYDCMVKTRCSFLLVHPGVVLYAATPFYALAPSTITLFVLRSALVAVSAVPLYWLTRQVTGSGWKALLAAGIFLVWAPSYLGDAFSLHLETLLPLEMFTLAALWVAGRYRLGLFVALLSFLTIEVAPIFTFLIGAFFLLPLVGLGLRRPWRRTDPATSASPGARGAFAGWWSALREGFLRRDVRYALALMGVSLAAYIALLTFMNVWGPSLLGVISPALPPGVGGTFSNNSSPAAAPLSVILASHQTVLTAEYWLILYATLAFLPLLCPRALILSVPWIGWTFLTNSNRFTTLGHQYSMIPAGPLFIGLAFALAWMPPRRAGVVSDAGPEPGPTDPGSRAPTRARWSPGGRRERAVWATVLGVAIAGNFLLAPVNPLLPDLGINPGAPFQPQYFDHSLDWNPSVDYVESMIATIPTSATVTAPSSFFPLLANYPHAYVLVTPSKLNTTVLPFPVVGGPDYVMIDPASLSMLTAGYRANLTDPAMYGLASYVGATELGPLLLYQKGFAGATHRFGPALPPPRAEYAPGSGLTPGPSGRVEANATAPTGGAVSSKPNRTGLVSTTAAAFLPPGSFTVSVTLAWAPTSAKYDPATPTLHVGVVGFGGVLVNATYTGANLTRGAWTTLAWNVSISNPLPNVEIQVSIETIRASVEVGAASLAPLAD